MELKKYKLGDIAEIIVSSIDKKSKEGEEPIKLCNFVNVYHNWAISTDMVQGFMNATTSEKNIERFSLKKGYVAFTKDSETRDDIGIPTYIADSLENTVLGYHCALVKPNEKILSGKYLNAFLHSNYIKKYFELNATGSGMRYTLSMDTLNNIPVLIPSLKIQKRIGGIFSDIDCKISLNRAINHNLEAMAKQLYDYWFVQFDFPNEEGKPYKSSGGKMVWNGKLNREMPEGWGVEKIKDIANTYSGGTPKSTEMEYYENGNIPWINSGELNKPIITNTSNFITQSGLDNSSAKLYPSNAILIALYGATAGKVSLLSFEACSNQAICGIILNDSVMLDYTRLYLSSLYEHFITLSTGSARDNISQDTVKNTNVIMPQKEVLVSFNQIIRKTTEMLVKNLVEITSLTKQRDELLPLLMNGQVSVNYDLSHIKKRDRKPFYIMLSIYEFTINSAIKFSNPPY